MWVCCISGGAAALHLKLSISWCLCCWATVCILHWEAIENKFLSLNCLLPLGPRSRSILGSELWSGRHFSWAGGWKRVWVCSLGSLSAGYPPQLSVGLRGSSACSATSPCSVPSRVPDPKLKESGSSSPPEKALPSWLWKLISWP